MAGIGGKRVGAGRKAGSRNKRTGEIEVFARTLVTDPAYQAALRQRLEDGVLAPAMETMLFYYAFGKPVEHLEHAGPGGTAITFVYGSTDAASLI